MVEDFKKINVGLIFGGKSTEHEVSLRSAKSIYEALDKNKYNVFLIGIGHNGQWFLEEDAKKFLAAGSVENFVNPTVVTPVSTKETTLTETKSGKDVGIIDVVFPIIHGTYGEDGCLQGFLELLDVPYVGPSVLGSAVGMDKDVAKRLLVEANIAVADYVSLHGYDNWRPKLDEFIGKLGLPVFVKPANLGSSVGITKAKTKAELETAIDLAFSYDTKVLIEKNIIGRELECAVLGNDRPEASILGEVIPTHEFYSYEAKYLDENGAVLDIPAKLTIEQTKKGQALAIKVFQTLECSGMARVDFFLTSDNEWYVNEVNTIPGFTSISMYPKLWEACGVSYSELLNKLISLAIEKKTSQKKIKRSYS